MHSSAELDRLALRVRAASRDGGLIETAQVKLIGLEEVRRAAGARWPRMRENVRDGSLKIIASQLGGEDAVIPCGDGFLTVFANTSPDEIARRVSAMREALLRFYLGEDALRGLRADVERQSVTADSLEGLVVAAGAAEHAQVQRNELQLGRFWPLWSLRHQAIAAHLCAPALKIGRGKSRLGYCADFVERAHHRERDYLDLDICLLEQACAAAELHQGAAIGASVHATTLQSRRSRQIYLEHVEANAAAPKDRMFISVAEIEPGTPLISLCEWSNALRRTFSRVAFDLHHSDRALGAIGSTGIWAAGHHLPASVAGPSSPLRNMLNHVHSWCRTLHKQGIQPLMHGFDDHALLDMAAHSDLAFATGPTLWPPAAGLEKAQALRSAGKDVEAHPPC